MAKHSGEPAPPLSSRRTVQCYHCRHRFDIGTQAKSSSCPKCSKPLLIEDVVIKTHHAVRKIQTCGKVIVQKKGRLVAQMIEAHGGVEVEGGLEGNVTCAGLVKIGPKAYWKGDCKALLIAIEGGSTIAGGYFVVPSEELRPPNAAPGP